MTKIKVKIKLNKKKNLLKILKYSLGFATIKIRFTEHV